MLMSLPNSVGIDPASANEDVFKASGRLVLPHQVKLANEADLSVGFREDEGTAC
jgi:hypothetical protein